MTTLKGSERQKMLINYIKEGIVPEGFYVKHTKNGTIQFRRIKKKDTQSMIEKYEKKLEELKEKLREEQQDKQDTENIIPDSDPESNALRARASKEVNQNP
ncbi:MAG: hypothetical protein ACOYEB_09080 [Enterococcus lemanii]|jgi:ketol-acid reductoisomerase